MFRLDDDVWPTKFRCATVSPEELVALRKVRDVVRMGRVVRINPTTIVLDRGELPTNADTLHVDCTADGLTRRPPCDVFERDRITLQSVVMCQPVFSAAVIAMVELRHGDDEALKNDRMKPVPHPEVPRDWFACNLTMFENMDKWKPYTWWLLRNRLSLASHMSPFGVGRLLIASLRWQKKAIHNIGRIRAELP